MIWIGEAEIEQPVEVLTVTALGERQCPLAQLFIVDKSLAPRDFLWNTDLQTLPGLDGAHKV